MVGDTPYDAEAAFGAGTAAAGLLTGGFAKEVLAEARCFVVARDLCELVACFEKNQGARHSPQGGESRSPSQKSYRR